MQWRARLEPDRAPRRVRRDTLTTGVHVVLLGPDGAGKSSVARELARRLSSPVELHRIQPAVFQIPLKPPDAASPHKEPPRSQLWSLAKASLWFMDFTLGYWLVVRRKLRRGTVVVFERYLLDAIVDPRRYQYGGPAWVVRLIWAVVPKPDLVILLDAPPEILRSRKQEVSAAETERQVSAYRDLVRSLRRGVIIDATESLAESTGRVLKEIESVMARWSGG